jgi:hypothetical protein
MRGRRGLLGGAVIGMTTVVACTALVDTKGLAGGAPVSDAAIDAGSPAALENACAIAGGCTPGARCISSVCVPAEGLRAWWSFEPMQGKVPDLSGSGNDGTSYQTQSVAGKRGMGIQIGANACVLVPDSPSLRLADAQGLTMMAWTRATGCADSTRDHGLILNKEDTYELGVQCAGLVMQEALNTTGGWNWRGSSGLTASKWQHVAVTWDGRNVTHYVDGQPTDSHPQMGRFSSGASGLGIGCRDVGADGNPTSIREWLAGTLDEVAVYSRALSATELRAYFDASR